MILTTYKLSDCLRSHGLLVVSRETLRLRVRGQQQEQLAGEEAQAGRQEDLLLPGRRSLHEKAEIESASIVIPNLHVPVLGSCWPVLWSFFSGLEVAVERVRDVAAGMQYPSHTMSCSCRL